MLRPNTTMLVTMNTICKSMLRQNTTNAGKWFQLENSCLTSQGLHAVFKCDLLATAGNYCLSNLITNVLRTTECNCTCSLEQETHMYRVWLCNDPTERFLQPNPHTAICIHFWVYIPTHLPLSHPFCSC